MIADEKQQGEQTDASMMLENEFQLPPFGHVDVSEDLLATHISREKKTLFWVPSECMTAYYGMYSTQLRVRTSFHNEIMKPFRSHLH